MKDIYIGLKFCFSYFTILPVNISNDIDVTKNSIIKSFLFFLPFIGFVLSALSIALSCILEDLSYLGLIIAAIFYMVLYGFLHTEAIADVADALYAKHSDKDAYKIIKEPTIGAMGLLYTIVFVILKIALIVYILYYDLFYEFIIVLLMSRLALLINIKIFTPHEKSTFIILMKKKISLLFLFITFVFYSLFILYFTSTIVFIIGLFILFSSFLTVLILRKKLGFINGDVLGVSVEISEIVGIFVFILAFISKLL